MSLASFETGILVELRAVTGNRKLWKKDIMEWSTGQNPITPGVGEGQSVIANLNGWED